MAKKTKDPKAQGTKGQDRDSGTRKCSNCGSKVKTGIQTCPNCRGPIPVGSKKK